MGAHRSRDGEATRAEAPSDAGGRRPIRVLPPDLVDRIAAGEVVERPASVVKELVENSLDAGATHVTVEVEGGGKRLIRVLDNGIGMSAAEARLALQRHATSKLRSLDDLFALGTMGFRGEALPSIASVSRMILTTRTRDELAGTQLEIDGGRIVGEREVGAPVGTCIEVHDLLAHVPARLKFLKGDATEASHVTDAVSKLAMAHPSVHVRLRHGARTAVEAPLHADGLERARALLGSRIGRLLHPVEGEEGGVRVVAYLAAPELAQSTSRAVQLYVGRRAVRDRGLLHALHMGYGELVPKGRYPVAVVFVDVPGDEVDVNVHPQKLEVRFSDPQLVYAAVRHTVRRGVAGAPWLDEAAGASPVRMHAVAQVAPPHQAEPGAGPRRPASPLAIGQAAEQARMLLPFGRARRTDPLAVPPPRGASPLPAREAPEPGLRETHFPLADAAPLPAAPSAHRGAEGPLPGAPAAPDRDAHPHDAPSRRAASQGGRAASPWPDSQPPLGSQGQAGGAAGRWQDADRPLGSPREGQAGGAAGRWQHTDRPLGSPPEGPAGGAENLWREAERPLGSPPPQGEGQGGGARTVDPVVEASFLARLRYLGQLDRTYLLCEGDGELVLLDQHAAHERVQYQRLRDSHARRELPVQRLLFPQPLELSGEQAAAVDEHAAALASVGYEVVREAGAAHAIAAVPAGLTKADPAAVLVELLDDLIDRGGSRAVEERLDLVLATIACHSSVRAGDVLGPREAEALLEALDRVDFKAHCPHGRPVLLRIGVAEIARRFGR